MFLWYSSCWVWNASVSKARRRARQKLGEKSEFQCLLVMVHGKVTILCLIFLKHWAYAFFFSVNYCLWIYIFAAWEHQKQLVLCLGFTNRGRSLLETLGSLIKMVFNYKSFSFCCCWSWEPNSWSTWNSWSRGHVILLLLCHCPAFISSTPHISYPCVELSRDFVTKTGMCLYNILYIILGSCYSNVGKRLTSYSPSLDKPWNCCSRHQVRWIWTSFCFSCLESSSFIIFLATKSRVSSSRVFSEPQWSSSAELGVVGALLCGRHREGDDVRAQSLQKQG